MSVVSGILGRFAAWALARNTPGAYTGEDDKRWAYVIETDGDKYLTRIMLPWRILGVRPYLHRFHRADADRFPHNHPWAWAFSLILCGSYDEERIDADGVDSLRLLRAACGGIDSGTRDYTLFSTRRVVRWFNFLRDTDYHRVEKLNGDVWTLFVTGPRHGDDWGFLVEGKHVNWKTFLNKEI